MKPADLAAVLREFHHEKLALRQRHAAVAKHVTDYAFNNTYQYVIAREDVHLSWLEAALADLGATPDVVAEPSLGPPGRKDGFLALVAEDAREAGEFVARWRARTDEVTNARHRGMMGVILGETLEQKRFFDQMTAGREDLLGRRANGPGSPGTGDGVLPVRWIE
ncbi:MAG TPA: hypothetical protein VLT86_20210 [Vicinamibacterales bacterium]|nr:hypothetical protein [Vicinamibacterales bacterium]